MCDVRVPQQPQRKHTCHLTFLSYVMKIIPLVSAAELRMAARTSGILTAFKSFNENLTFSQTLHQRFCMQMEKTELSII